MTTKSDKPATARTQRGAILQVLTAARGAWVPLPEIMKLAAQYNARIFELRRQGFKIDNRHQDVDGQRHSWFRLATGPHNATPKPAATLAPADSLFATDPAWQEQVRIARELAGLQEGGR